MYVEKAGSGSYVLVGGVVVVQARGGTKSLTHVSKKVGQKGGVGRKRLPFLLQVLVGGILERS